MHSAGGLVGAVQAEGRDADVEGLAGGGDDHVVGPPHEAGWRAERRAGGVFEALPRLENRLFADHALALHLLGAAEPIGDLPGALHQLHRLPPLIGDGDAVGPDEVAALRLGLVGQVEGAHRDADRTGRVAVVVAHPAPMGPLAPARNLGRGGRGLKPSGARDPNGRRPSRAGWPRRRLVTPGGRAAVSDARVPRERDAGLVH